jgi:hypothetical protein
MIAPVGLSSEALMETCGQEGDRLAEMHRQLAGLLFAHGQLVFADSSAEAAFRDQVLALGRLSPNAAKSWDVLLEHGRLAHADPPPPNPLESIMDLPILLEDWDRVVAAAFVEPDRAEILGCPRGAIAWRPPAAEIEIACHDVAVGSDTLSSLRRLSEQPHIEEGSDRERFWDERLAPLVRAADEVHIFDRYIGKDLMQGYRARAAAKPGRRLAPQVTEWLLQRITAEANNATLSIYTQYTGDQDRRVLEITLKDAAQKYAIRRRGGLKEFRAFLVRESRWPRHDRHLRADNAGIELSAGFDRLSKTAVMEEFTATYMYLPDSVRKLRKAENGVRAALIEPPLQLL